MARTPLENVISNWNKLFENFEASPKDFYDSLREAVDRREIPGASYGTVTWNEEGVLTARREYLRVKRERHVFDVCAAPFGTGFFFSWWLVERIPLRGLFYAPFLAILMIGIPLVFWALRGEVRVISEVFYLLTDIPFVGSILWYWYGTPILVLVSILTSLWVTAWFARRGRLILEDGVLFIPVVNWIYSRFFRPMTYHRLDSASMFQTAVHSAMMEVLDGMTSSKGLRSLSEEERKPVMQGFFGR